MSDELSLSCCEIIPNIVDVGVFNKKRYKRGATLRLVVVAGFRNGKNLDDIIKGMDVLVHKRNMNVHLDMVGDGYLMEYLKEMVGNLKLNDYVTFTGRKSKEEVSSILANNDIYLIASDTETFCIPGVEALASGLVLVSSRCKGPLEYIDSKCGEFFDAHDIEGMCDAIERVSKKLDKYDVNYLRSVSLKYSRENVANIAINVYKKMLDKNKKAH